MSDLIEMYERAGFTQENWHFVIDDRDKEGSRVRTYREDERVIAGWVEFWTDTSFLSANVFREGDQWVWEAGGPCRTDFGYVSTLTEAVSAVEANMKRMLLH